MADDLEAALGAAFGVTPPAPKPVSDAVEPPEEEAPAVEAEAEPLEAEGEEEQPKEAVAEPEFEIEVDGAREIIRGADKIKETLQKGLHYSKNSEAVAREREAIQATAKHQQEVSLVQQALQGDIAELQAMDQQLEQWARVDLSALFETDGFKALQLKEQRDQLREARSAKFNELQRKAQHAASVLQTARSQSVAAEEQALLAKLPEWRNSEKAQAESGKIKDLLRSTYGYTKQEVDNIGDHRNMLVARDAYLYRQLMANKDARVKQVREAPGMVRPGAPAQPNGRTEFAKARAKIREFGTKGNHAAQENMVTKMFERAFK